MTKEKYKSQVLYTYWESLTSKCYHRQDPITKEKYKKIGCIFNHTGFYANIQQDDFADSTNLNLSDKKCWNAIEKDKIDKLPKYNIEISLE